MSYTPGVEHKFLDCTASNVVIIQTNNKLCPHTFPNLLVIIKRLRSEHYESMLCEHFEQRYLGTCVRVFVIIRLAREGNIHRFIVQIHNIKICF
jgi:hypothetical protein